ncbi:golgi SNAP receptor complex member Gos28 [Rhodnius prolixus]|uniref:Golgi SNAP receptor complex member 1 n=2 Tax=Rhodnius TaxID=13248 RepID=R4G830_RHOPR
MSSTSYEDLRKQARRLENEIDLNLISFCKLCAGKVENDKGEGVTEPLLASERGRDVEAASLEIEGLLLQLKAINEQMSEMPINSTGFAQHTLQRHREILADYSSEFNKTLDNYRARKNKEDLLRNVRTDMNYKPSTSSGLNRRMDLYLKENEHIRSSSRLIDDQISIAVETREELMSQRLTMKKLQTRLHDVSSRLPIVNSLLHRINFRRRRDSFIVGLVVFICTILLLTALFR